MKSKASKVEYDANAYKVKKEMFEESFSAFMSESSAIYEVISKTTSTYNIPSKRMEFVLDNLQSVKTRLDGMWKSYTDAEGVKKENFKSCREDFTILSTKVPLRLTLIILDKMNRLQLSDQKKFSDLSSNMIAIKLELKEIKTQKHIVSMILQGIERATRMKRGESDTSVDSFNDEEPAQKMTKKGLNACVFFCVFFLLIFVN